LRNTGINYLLFRNALRQAGPYKNEEIPFCKNWIIKEFEKKISSIDWKSARLDVENFLTMEDKKFVTYWSESLFLSQLEKIQIELAQAVIFRIAKGTPPNIDIHLFSSAITRLNSDDAKKIVNSKTYWYQSLKEIELLEDIKEYACLFINFDDPGHKKHMHMRHDKLNERFLDAIPGEEYLLEGWFIKAWNQKKLQHAHNIPRALFWFQPIQFLPKHVKMLIASYSKENGIERNRYL
jgi:hypothetical protein